MARQRKLTKEQIEMLEKSGHVARMTDMYLSTKNYPAVIIENWLIQNKNIPAKLFAMQELF